MDYIAPYGSADPNASYQDRNTPGAVAGSKVPAAAVESPMREIMAVITGAGVTPSKADLTQLKQAIQAMIDAATGGAETSNYVLMTAARARLPVYPHVLSSDGKLPCLSPAAGTARIPAGYEFIHRGIYSVTTVETDFVTAANKTYHIRWNPTDGFTMKDLADSGYNSGALSEEDESFDSDYDDMLIARVVTNASNVSTVTNLVNLDRLMYSQAIVATNYQAANSNEARGDIVASFNWSRTPKMKSFSTIYRSEAGDGGGQNDFDETMFALGSYPTAATEIPATRYEIAYTMGYDFSAAFTHQVNAEA